MSVSNDEHECKAVYYLQQISSAMEDNIFKTPWSSVIIKNCNSDGKLLQFKSKKDYASSERSLWLIMPLKVFRAEQDLFPVFCCPECSSMRNFMSLQTDCNPDQFLPLLCLHSRAVSFLITDWTEIWNVDVADDDTANELNCNDDIIAMTFREKPQKNEGFFLAASRLEGKIYILYTATNRQNIPMCSGHACHLSHCVHYRKYLETVEEENYVAEFNPLFDHNTEVHENIDGEIGERVQDVNIHEPSRAEDQDHDVIDEVL